MLEHRVKEPRQVVLLPVAEQQKEI